MAVYNIIYHSPDGQAYLWSGSSFDLVKNEDNEKLLYSGKTFEKKEVPSALKKGREAARAIFKTDSKPELKAVEIIVNNKDNERGHKAHITS